MQQLYQKLCLDSICGVEPALLLLLHRLPPKAPYLLPRAAGLEPRVPFCSLDCKQLFQTRTAVLQSKLRIVAFVFSLLATTVNP